MSEGDSWFVEHMTWHLSRLKAMSGPEVYDMLALRQKVFMLEQRIPVLDADGEDMEALHLCGRGPLGLAAYARIFPPGDHEEERAVHIGRVCVDDYHRGEGIGRALMEQALNCAHDLAPTAPVLISAQAHLVAFYESLGFQVDGEIYDDHGVPHVDMMRYSPQSGAPAHEPDENQTPDEEEPISEA